jgi:hypothetical protein
MDKETKNHRQKNNKKSIYRRQMSGTNLSLPGDLIKEIGFPSYTKIKTYWNIDKYYNQAVLTSEVSEEMLIEDISLGTISDVESNESDDQLSGGRIRIPEDMPKICFSRLKNCDEVILIPVYQHKNRNLDNTLVYVCPAQEFDELLSTIVSNGITHRGPNVLPGNPTQIDLIPMFSPARVDENMWFQQHISMWITRVVENDNLRCELSLY